MLKKLLLSVWVVLLPSYCYSESIAPYYGYTGNAADGTLRWDMGNVFPSDIPGLDVNAVLYNYKINKDVNDHVDVYVQNEDAIRGGYIFREHDEWRPGSLGGTQINKVIAIPNINRSYWGDGSIEVDGNGSVSDTNVVYSYRVDPCFNPQFDPNCPGYQVPTPPEPEVIDVTTIYDATDGDSEIAKIDTEEQYDDEEEKSEKELAEEEAEEEKDRKERLEKALAAADNSALFANALANSRVLETMNAKVNMNSYYTKFIAGGEYNDSVALDGGNIPDNPQGRRLNFSTQKLHNEMVDMQYNR